MIDELCNKLPEFGGRASHTRCFLHTTNLIAKALLRQFDEKKGRKKASQNASNAIESDEVSENEEVENEEVNDVGGDLEDQDDSADGLIPLMDEMDPTERAAHNERVRPVKLVLVKVSFHARLPVLLIPCLPSSARWRSKSSTRLQSYSWHGMMPLIT